ncbi:hypothetical protein OG474_16800 [Kribbella sp. NBC_01505]|uniref:hypothetical protein n=1 Tax=Kribbella sp. NBC_01505 TaxID=2903580 RepID=UPI0038697F65
MTAVDHTEEQSVEPAEESPVVHGYFREHMFMGHREKADLRARLDQAARQHGYRLGKVFEERVETTPAAFGALVDAAVEDSAAVIVPGIEHLAIHGHATMIRDSLAAAIGAPVLVATR